MAVVCAVVCSCGERLVTAVEARRGGEFEARALAEKEGWTSTPPARNGREWEDRCPPCGPVAAAGGAEDCSTCTERKARGRWVDSPLWDAFGHTEMGHQVCRRVLIRRPAGGGDVVPASWALDLEASEPGWLSREEGMGPAHVAVYESGLRRVREWCDSGQ